MNKIILILAIITIGIFGPISAQSVKIPEVLLALGYSHYEIIEYLYVNDRVQHYTFYNESTEDLIDTITFVIQDGKIVKIIKKGG